MKRIFTLFLSLCLCTLVMGQRPEAVIAKAGDVKPVIDGVLDDLWADVEQHDVNRNFTGETPTLGAEGTTYWKALWDDKGMYIIIVANDNVWYPYSGTGDAYTFDKIELYFDTNYVLDDHVGGQNQATGNRQIAPDPTLDKLDGELLTQTILGGVVQYAYKVENPKWTTEWFIPWASIPDGEGNLFDRTATMGFDVDITDNDNDGKGRQRAMWSNIGTVAENWTNMDDAGHITLEGAEPGIDITAIALSGPTEITTDNGTAQLVATLTPANATQGYKWVITEGAANASISVQGLVTAIRDGVVKVKAVSSDDFTSSNEVTITISGQTTTLLEVSYIKDGDFTMGTATNQSTYWTGGRADAIEDGVYTIINPTLSTDPWGYTVGQNINIPQDMKDMPFVLQFKAWADEPRIFDVDIEHGDPYVRFGDTPDANADAGRSQWTYNLTTEPTVYTQQITNFSRMEPLPQTQKFNLFAGRGTAKVYVDKIILVTKADFDNLATSSKTMDANSIKVYPNPVGNGQTLFVELTQINSKVAVYNATGQKLTEKTANGYKTSFDVSSLRQGLYFIKTSDGSVQKFVK